MGMDFLRWLVTLVCAFAAGKLVSRLKMPAILGWLIAGMLLGPHALQLMPQTVMDTVWYKTVITWMQCAFGLMLGMELIWKRIRSCGKALMLTTLAQSLGTFAFVSLVFAAVFALTGCRCIWPWPSAASPWPPRRRRPCPSCRSSGPGGR